MPYLWSLTEVWCWSGLKAFKTNILLLWQMSHFHTFDAGQNVRPLNKREYILDITTEAEPIDSTYSLWFRRVIWTQLLKFDNELSVSVHYNQVAISRAPIKATDAWNQRFGDTRAHAHVVCFNLCRYPRTTWKACSMWCRKGNSAISSFSKWLNWQRFNIEPRSRPTSPLCTPATPNTSHLRLKHGPGLCLLDMAHQCCWQTAHDLHI